MNPSIILPSLRQPSAENPLRILMSACLHGALCTWDESRPGLGVHLQAILKHEAVKITPFCPEDFAYGTPRMLSDIHGGSGFDVLDGKAKILTESGEDWTQGMLAAAERMLQVAQEARVDLAILLDVSAACGSQVIYMGARRGTEPRHQASMGVCAARLTRAGIPVISQRDFKALGQLHKFLEPGIALEENLRDHHESDWYMGHFGTQGELSLSRKS